MKSDWLKDVAQEDKQDRMDMVQSARPTLDLLKSILTKKLDNLQAVMLSRTGYDSPSWAYEQADLIGEIRSLNYVISLLTLDRETK